MLDIIYDNDTKLLKLVVTPISQGEKGIYMLIEAERMEEYSCSVQFAMKHNHTYATARMELTDGFIETTIPDEILAETGTVGVQLVFYGANGEVLKSCFDEDCYFIVSPSINAEEN